MLDPYLCYLQIGLGMLKGFQASSVYSQQFHWDHLFECCFYPCGANSHWCDPVTISGASESDVHAQPLSSSWSCMQRHGDLLFHSPDLFSSLPLLFPTHTSAAPLVESPWSYSCFLPRQFSSDSHPLTSPLTPCQEASSWHHRERDYLIFINLLRGRKRVKIAMKGTASKMARKRG